MLVLCLRDRRLGGSLGSGMLGLENRVKKDLDGNISVGGGSILTYRGMVLGFHVG